jgi:hypothetical protein
LKIPISGLVAGQLGFLLTVTELLLAFTIILLTVLSLCAVSSNGAVEGGGVYCNTDITRRNLRYSCTFPFRHDKPNFGS